MGLRHICNPPHIGLTCGSVRASLHLMKTLGTNNLEVELLHFI